MANNSVNSKTSRFVQGGITEVGSIGLEWWDRFNFPTDATDLVYTIEEQFAGRIELISYAFYAEARYWWVIAQYNNILDPFSEIVPGRVLYIPSLERLQLLLSQRTGGTSSTRSAESILPPLVL